MSNDSYQQYQGGKARAGGFDRQQSYGRSYNGGSYGAPSPAIPEVVLLNQDGTVNPDIVDKTASACADVFVTRNIKADIKSSQLRRFYADVKALELRMENGSFSSVLPQIKLLKAKVAYARARNLVPEEFRKWLADCADKVHDEKTFRAFLLHFEAVVGFCYGNGLKDNG